MMTHTYNRVWRLAAVFCLGVPMLQSCGPMTVRDARTGAWVPMQAAVLDVHRDIVIPGGHTRAFFQNGAPVPHINEFQPFCQLEVNTLKEQARSVHPDRFTVTRVGRSIKEVVEARPVMLAMLGGFALTHDDGPSRVTQMFSLRLHSERQPDVRGLACGGAFDAPGHAYAPTMQEIAVALGDFATLALK